MKVVGLPVFTDMGDRIGTIASLEYDENNQIKIYHVRRAGILGFFRKNILIYPRTVISIDDKKMIVRGTEIKIKEPAVEMGGAFVSN